MDSSGIYAGTEEEHSSCESGWTAYIGGSSIAKNLSSGEHEDTCNNRNKSWVDNGNESDDSMTSDASSGPCFLKLQCKSSEQGYGKLDRYKPAASKYPLFPCPL